MAENKVTKRIESLYGMDRKEAFPGGGER